MKDVHPSIREVAVLQESTEMILSSMDVDTVLHQILLIVRNYFGVANCAVFLVDTASGSPVLRCRAHNGYPNPVTGMRTFKAGEDCEGVVGWAARTKGLRYVPDVAREPRYIKIHGDVRSELALPLVVRDEVIGVLNLESEQLDFFADEIIGLLALFAGQAAIALENARLYSSERRRMRQIELINLIAHSATSATDVDQFLAGLADLMFDTFEGCDVAVLLRDRNARLLLRAHAGTLSLANVQDSLFVSERSGCIAQALTGRANIAVDDVLKPGSASSLGAPTGSELCVPLLSLGEVLGVIVVSHPRAAYFTPENRSIGQVAGDVCATAIKNMQLTEELRRILNSDSLTGLSNQRYFHNIVAVEASRARRYGKKFSLVLLDIQGFQKLNIALGFDRGDDLLRRVAHILSSQVRAIDTACRYSSDRFALLLPEIDPQQVDAVVAKVQDGLRQIAIGGSAQPLSAVWGAVHYPRDVAADSDLVRLLLTRLAAAKQTASAAGS